MSTTNKNVSFSRTFFPVGYNYCVHNYRYIIVSRNIKRGEILVLPLSITLTSCSEWIVFMVTGAETNGNSLYREWITFQITDGLPEIQLDNEPCLRYPEATSCRKEEINKRSWQLWLIFRTWPSALKNSWMLIYIYFSL